jgi:choline-sulfatase
MADNDFAASRRQFLKTGLAGAGLAGLNQLTGESARADGPAASALAGKPNILIIMVDEQRYPTVYESRDLRVFRKTYLKTQEALRRRGMEFHRHYTASVACVPSRTSFYTGHYPSLHGVANTDGTAKDVHDPDMFWLDANSVPTIGNYFREAGYRTFYKGKWHISHADLSVPGTRDSLASYDDQGNRDPNKEALYLAAKRLENFGFTGWIGPEPHGSNPLNSASSARGKKGRDEAIAGHMVELIDQLEADADTTPWLAVCGFINPHDIAAYGLFTRLSSEAQGAWDYDVGAEVPTGVFNPNKFPLTRRENLTSKPACQESYRNAYQSMFQSTYAGQNYYRLYYQLHKDVDEQMAKVYARLKASRFFNNTIVVFTSDHGDLLGSHGGLHQKWYTAYEEALRVPLIVSYPKIHTQAASTDILTSHVDILPTLLGLAGLDAEPLRQSLAQRFCEARALVGKDVSAAVIGAADPASLDAPIYFMTDDDPSRGLNQNNFIGLSYASVTQPNHIETVVVRVGAELWKYSRYFDNPAYWSDPGTPGADGVMDEVAQEIGAKDDVGSYPVSYMKTVKDTPRAEQFEMYNLSSDPMELSNLAGDPNWSSLEVQLRDLLAQQCTNKRLSPTNGEVPGQIGCG